MSCTSSPRIAIIGAGPAGLTLGALLHKHNVPFMIFDLRPQPTESDLAAVSSMLDLHVESGLAAIKACGLYDQFVPLTAECEQSFRVVDSNGVLRLSGPMGANRPEISRHNLTRLLLSEIPPEAIRWQHKLRSAEKREDSTVWLDFGEDHEVVDLVVGADGAWSRVRQALLPDASTPRYTGVQNLVATATHIGTQFPHLADIVGRGTMFSAGMGHQCAGHRGPRDSLRLHLSVRTDEEDFVHVRGLEGLPAAEVASMYLKDDKLFGKWGEKMQDLIQTVCGEETRDHPGQSAEIRGIYELPIGHTWQHRSGVTVIGDAAHLMTPWAGEGANISMWDSLDLASVIAAAWEAVVARGHNSARAWREELDPKLAQFEKSMQERAAIHAQESSDNGRMLFSDDAVDRLVAFFQSFGVPPE